MSSAPPAAILEYVQALWGAVLDAYVVVDLEARVVAFNRLFFSLFPRSIGRRLKGQAFDALLRLEIQDQELCIAAEVLSKHAVLRYDEVQAYITDGPNLPLIVSASPLLVPDHDEVLGAVIVLRDMSDLAQVQSKYQRMLSAEAKERQQLEYTIQEQGQRILELCDELNRQQSELLALRKRLLV
jgi:PAS domain-containing protein